MVILVIKKNKIFFFLFSILLLSNCSIKENYISADGDYVTDIVSITLKQFPFEKYRLIATPQNENIERYRHGFVEDTLNFEGVKFYYSKNKIKSWNNFFFKDYDIKDNIEIIKNFNTVNKVSVSEPEKANVYISLSNIMYTLDNNFAIINLNTFYNLEFSDYGQGYILVFRKENNEWIYIGKFGAYVS